jgi:hypothetical protein
MSTSSQELRVLQLEQTVVSLQARTAAVTQCIGGINTNNAELALYATAQKKTTLACFECGQVQMPASNLVIVFTPTYLGVTYSAVTSTLAFLPATQTWQSPVAAITLGGNAYQFTLVCGDELPVLTVSSGGSSVTFSTPFYTNAAISLQWANTPTVTLLGVTFTAVSAGGTTETSCPAACQPCNIPVSTLTVSWSNSGGGTGEIPMIGFGPNPPFTQVWVTGCAVIGPTGGLLSGQMAFTLSCGPTESQFTVFTFTTDSGSSCSVPIRSYIWDTSGAVTDPPLDLVDQTCSPLNVVWSMTDADGITTTLTLTA